MKKNRQCYKCPYDGKKSTECLKCIGREDEKLSGHGRLCLSGTWFDPSFTPEPILPDEDPTALPALPAISEAEANERLQEDLKKEEAKGRGLVARLDPDAEEHLLLFLYKLFDLTPSELLFFQSTLRGNSLTDSMADVKKTAEGIMKKGMTRQYAYKLRKSIGKKLGEDIIKAISGVSNRRVDIV